MAISGSAREPAFYARIIDELIQVKSHSGPQILVFDLFKLHWYSIPSHLFNIGVFINKDKIRVNSQDCYDVCHSVMNGAHLS